MGEKGYVLMITEVGKVGLGKISDEDGSALYRIEYQALVFRPFKSEIVDTIVTSVSSRGITCAVGPFEFFVDALVCKPRLFSSRTFFFRELIVLVRLFSVTEHGRRIQVC